MSEVTQILSAIERGDPAAAEQLLPLVYDELRKLAAAKMAQEKPGQTLQATALVHEAYIRLVGSDHHAHWDNQGHFFAAAAEAMRRILIEQARRKQSEKHGGGRHRFELGEQDLISNATPDRILALDEALTKLGREEPESAELVKLRAFAGLSVEQAANVLGISRANAYGGHVLTWSLTKKGGSALAQDLATVKQFAVMGDSRILFRRDSAKDAEYYDPIKETLEPARAERLVQAMLERNTVAVAASPNAKWVLFPEGKALVVWNVFEDGQQRTLSHQSGSIGGGGFSPDSRFLVTIGRDSEVRLWRTDDWSWEVLRQKVRWIWGIGFSGDSRRVAISQDNAFIRVFDL